MCAWDVNKPAGTLTVSAVDDQIRADKVTLQASLNAEHVFTAGDTICGHREGSARISIAVVADEGALDTSEGRLYFDPETGLLMYADSEGAWQVLQPKRAETRLSYINATPDSIQTASTDWADIPNVVCNHVRASEAHSLYVEAVLTVQALVSGKDLRLRLTVDDVPVTTATKGQVRVGYGSGVTTVHMAFIVNYAVLGEDLENAVKVQWQVDASGGGDLTADYNICVLAFDL